MAWNAAQGGAIYNKVSANA